VQRPRDLAPGLALFPARTPTLPPATHTNSYALGGREVLLVEPATPFADEQQAWVEWARGLASQGRRLVAMLATHHHQDHIGGAVFFAGALGLPLWAHEATAARIQAPVARCLGEGETILLDGPEPQAWQVLHTPGHAPGHLCLHEATLGALVVGDMVASEGTILIAPGDGDMAEYLRQLDRLAGLDAGLALPAHGGPVADPTALFRRYIAHRLAREQKVLGAVDGSLKTLDQLVAVAYDDTPSSLFPLASLSLQAHLEKLVGEGRVALHGDRYTRGMGPG